MSRVFFSYVRDDQVVVERIYNRIQSKGIDAWMDTRDLVGGQDWNRAIEQRINEATYFVACFSRAYNERKRRGESPFMDRELAVAAERIASGSVPEGWLIQLWLDDSLDVETPVIDIETRHGIDFRGDEDRGIVELLEALANRQKGDEVLCRRYRVGHVEANVYMGLLGGNTAPLDRSSLEFSYVHQTVPLPDFVESHRADLVAEAECRAREHNHVLFNGPCIRLHSVKMSVQQCPSGIEQRSVMLELRPTCWYDYVLSNQRLDVPINTPELGRTTLRSQCANESRLVLDGDVNWIRLSNILTISVVMITTDGWTYLGHRTGRVDNKPGVLAATAAENVHRWKDESRDRTVRHTGQIVDADYRPSSCPNPFYTAIRAIEEEVGPEIARRLSLDNVKFVGLAWGLDHFSPHLYAVVRPPVRKKEVDDSLAANRAEDSWEANLFAVRFEPGGVLRDHLFQAQWAEVSKGAVLAALVAEHGYEAVASMVQ